MKIQPIQETRNRFVREIAQRPIITLDRFKQIIRIGGSIGALPGYGKFPYLPNSRAAKLTVFQELDK
jgi:hypothetical protein